MNEGKIKYLYKYMKIQHAMSLLKEDKLLLSTLHNFRDIKKIEIKDENEGKKQTVIDRPFSAQGQSELPVPLQVENLFRLDNSSKFISGGDLTVNVNSCDRYLYCTSQNCDFNDMYTIFADYDACIQIIDPNAFFQTITSYCKDEFDAYTLKKCTYSTRKFNEKNWIKERPEFIKEEKYSLEQEVRCVWYSNRKNKKLIQKIIQVPSISNYCRLISRKNI